jgi:hypothetical protein
MSGGHFDYQQYRIGQIADDIQILIETNGSTERNEHGDRIGRGYPEEVVDRFREAVKVLRTAQVYAQRIDWLVSGDDGPESFLRRLEEELKDD